MEVFKNLREFKKSETFNNLSEWSKRIVPDIIGHNMLYINSINKGCVLCVAIEGRSLGFYSERTGLDYGLLVNEVREEIRTLCAPLIKASDGSICYNEVSPNDEYDMIVKTYLSV